MSSTPTSESSTKVGSDSSMVFEDSKTLRRRTFERAQKATTAQDILLFLIAFRILNALNIRTFFQPDEFFQSLEPAWQIAFGRDSGAWITWVGISLSYRRVTADVKHALRSGNTSCALLYTRVSLPAYTGWLRDFPAYSDSLPHGMPTS